MNNTIEPGACGVCGAQEWRARFAPPKAGRYSWQTICSDASNRELHGRTGSLEVDAATSKGSFLEHGPGKAAFTGR